MSSPLEHTPQFVSSPSWADFSIMMNVLLKVGGIATLCVLCVSPCQLPLSFYFRKALSINVNSILIVNTIIPKKKLN